MTTRISSPVTPNCVEDFPAVVAKVVRSLRPGGQFVFSVEHPTATAFGTYEWQQGPAAEKATTAG